jgi:hypothetical protein
MAKYRAPRTSLIGGRLLHHRHTNRLLGAGWSSPVARQAHNLKVVGSNPTPATKLSPVDQVVMPGFLGFSLPNRRCFLLLSIAAKSDFLPMGYGDRVPFVTMGTKILHSARVHMYGVCTPAY